MNLLSHILARIIAILCAILFIVTALAALVLFNLEQHGLNPNTYKQALANGNFYQSLPSLLGQVLAVDESKSNTPYLKQLTSDDWTMVIQTLLPPEQLRAMTEEAITQILAYLNGETNDPHLSLLPLKERLLGPAGMTAAISLIHTQPDCTTEQLAQLITSFGQVLCNPPQNMLNLAKPIIQTQLNSIAAALPDQTSLAGTDASSLRLRNIRLIRSMMQLSPLIPLAFLFGVTIFAVRTFKGWMGWWGWPLLFVGVIGAIFGFGGNPVLGGAIEDSIARRTQLINSTQLTEGIRTVINAALREIFQPAGWQALIVAVIGLLMLIITFIIAQQEKNRRTKSSEAETQIHD